MLHISTYVNKLYGKIKYLNTNKNLAIFNQQPLNSKHSLRRHVLNTHMRLQSQESDHQHWNAVKLMSNIQGVQGWTQ